MQARKCKPGNAIPAVTPYTQFQDQETGYSEGHLISESRKEAKEMKWIF